MAFCMLLGGLGWLLQATKASTGKDVESNTLADIKKPPVDELTCPKP
jgi:hypothetical protein